MAGKIDLGTPEHNAHLARLKESAKPLTKKEEKSAIADLMEKTKEELVSIAAEKNIELPATANKETIAKAILNADEPK